VKRFGNLDTRQINSRHIKQKNKRGCKRILSFCLVDSILQTIDSILFDYQIYLV